MSVVLRKSNNSSPTLKLSCDTSVEVGDYVYIRPDEVLDKAKGDSIATMPAIGKVTKKISSTECEISDDLIDQDYTGIMAKQSIFISDTVAGQIQSFPPTMSGHVSQNVGIGLSSTKIKVKIDPSNILIRS
jgi:hypothetical protein